MKSVYQSRAVSYPPELPNSASSEGYPTNGSPTGGVLATVIGDYWYNAVTQEIVNAIKGGGVTPDAADLTQLDAAIKAQIRTVNQALSDVAAQIQAKVSQVEVVPSGMIMFFPKSTPPNGNWLICDGRAVSRAGYPNLFAMIGTQYGAGNGSTTFNVPYLIDRTVWGGTSNVGAYLQPGLPNITGAWRAAYEDRDVGTATTASGAVYATFDRGWGSQEISSVGSGGSIGRFFDASRSNPIYGRSGTVQPPALVLLPCIHI